MWNSKSHEKLASELNAGGHDVSPNTVGRLLVHELEYSRQVNRKTLEGTSHPDRNAQFEHINAAVIAAQAADQPVISIDTKKKELIGNYKNGGSDYRPKADPVCVDMHDFPDKEQGKIVPHGIYDPSANAGWVSVVWQRAIRMTSRTTRQSSRSSRSAPGWIGSGARATPACVS